MFCEIKKIPSYKIRDICIKIFEKSNGFANPCELIIYCDSVNDDLKMNDFWNSRDSWRWNWLYEVNESSTIINFSKQISASEVILSVDNYNMTHRLNLLFQIFSRKIIIAKFNQIIDLGYYPSNRRLWSSPYTKMANQKNKFSSCCPIQQLELGIWI